MLIPHLHFCGDCEEAIVLYEKAFGTKSDMILREADGNPVHAEMHIHGQRIMLNNRFGNKNKTTDCAVALIVTFENEEDLRACYEILRPDNTLIDPLNSASYTELGVQFLDRFGVQWAFMIEKSAL